MTSNSSSLHLETTCLPFCSWVFSPWNNGRILVRFPFKSSKNSGSFNSSLRKKTTWYYPVEISPFTWFTYPRKPLKDIKILRPPHLFSLFQKPSTIMNITEDILKVKSTIATATTSQLIRTKLSTVTLKRNGHIPNKEISKLSPSTLTLLSFIPPTPQQPSQQTNRPLFNFPIICQTTIVELLCIIPQRPSKISIFITFKHMVQILFYLFLLVL